MKKRFLSALLAAALALTLLPTALAATAAEDASQVLAALDIMVGDENGSLNLSAPVTRAEFVKMLMAASPVSVGDETAVSPEPDVPRTHWAAPDVEAAVRAGYVTGYLDGTFRPSNTITLSEGVVMVLRLLGYQNSDFSGSFPAGQMAMYRTLDLDEGISLGQNDTMTRQDAMYLFYNLLTAASKTTGAPYLSSVLGHSLTADGKVDTLALRLQRCLGEPGGEDHQRRRSGPERRSVLVQIHEHPLGVHQPRHRHPPGRLPRLGPGLRHRGREELVHRDLRRR